jgi:hypothetical protein
MASTTSGKTVTLRLDDLISRISDAHLDSLDRLSEAVFAAEYLGEIADHLIGHFVDQARGGGSSWTDIGKSMGVTKQAAQKRFVPREALPAPDAPFTAKAWNVLTIAQAQARSANNDHIAPCHIVLGLLGEPKSVAGTALTNLGVKPTDVKRRARATFPPAAVAVPELIPCNAAARKALELAQREALRLGHNYVGTEHLLLGLIEQESGDGLLSGLGLRPEAIRTEVKRILGYSEAAG